jgi:hypothetical protein
MTALRIRDADAAATMVRRRRTKDDESVAADAELTAA